MSDQSESDRAQIEQEVRRKAVQRVHRRLGFYWHLAVYLIANAAMVAINLTHSPEYYWFVWPMAGWGAALLLHGLGTFQGAGITEAMIEAEVQRELARRAAR